MTALMAAAPRPPRRAAARAGARRDRRRVGAGDRRPQRPAAAHALHHDTLIEGGRRSGRPAVALFLAAWVAMVVAMMLPSSLPLVRLFGEASGRQPHPAAARWPRSSADTSLVWTAFGGAAFAFDGAVHATVDAWPWLARHDWLIGASLLAVAGAFQFTRAEVRVPGPLPAPGAFLLRHYRRGARNALASARATACFCVGCCWALMLVMFAAGVASLVWMALLTTIMVHEKTHAAGRRHRPGHRLAALGLASILFLWGASA